jgi:putative chitinase
VSLLIRSVGKGAKHEDRNDARTVRLLLNANLSLINAARAKAGNGALLALPEHGHTTGPDQVGLNERIGEFQSPVMMAGGKSADQRVDPGGATEKALLRGLPKGFSALKLKLIAPKASDQSVARYATLLDAWMKHCGINTPLEQAHFLAQIAVESDDLKTAQEYRSGDEYEGREDLHNTEVGDGKRFKGRGLLQITGRVNYEAFGAYSKMSLTGPKDDANRQKLSDDPSLAVKVSCWFWMQNNLNQWADRDNVVNVSKITNAGNIHAKHVYKLHERQAYSRRAKAVLLP